MNGLYSIWWLFAAFIAGGITVATLAIVVSFYQWRGLNDALDDDNGGGFGI